MKYYKNINGNIVEIVGEELDEFLLNATLLDTVEVPRSITPRQARLALLQAALLDEIEAMLSTDKAMQIWWEYSLEIDRYNEHIVNAGVALGLSEVQIDQLFINGSKL